MRTLVLVTLAIIMMSMTVEWGTDFSKAEKQAKKESKCMLLYFSGSDWCAPCVRTQKSIFDSKAFSDFAAADLVLVNADFPHLKKNRLPQAQAKENDKLAKRYNKTGAFPLTVLLDADGRVLKEWKGYPGVTAEKFVEDIRAAGQIH